LKLEDRHNIR